MRSRRPSTEHQEAVSRRLAQLSAELAAARPEGPVAGWEAGSAAGGDDGRAWWVDHTRVSGRSLPPPAAPLPVPAAPAAGSEAGPPPAVPRPGRHAARRRLSLRRAADDLVPDTLRGRVAIGSAQLAVVAVLVAVGLAVTCWWVVRSDADPVSGRLTAAPAGAPLATPAALAAPSPSVPAAPGGAGAGGADAAGTVTVDVAGKVRRPGIAVLDAGSRVVDALEAAGGARHGADLSGLNLARVLVDGEQVLVGVAAPSLPAAVAPSGAPPAAPGGPLVDLNTATTVQLETLPEVGPVTAQAIIAWRDQHGGFTAVEELLEVDGIGAATLATIAPHVTV
ncbi:ComEA family DNA-binding protein [Nocardioides dongkuii]|uniref:ComEA family DNA-binding protein n=1 Tax=Nocardioides dongkuii TaxID=2760089 RepID=UPI0015F8414C|nr:ComEA family DNA-binding protein [Nocardioides dongkuii]